MTATIVLLLISQFSPIPQYELPVLQDLRPIRTVDYGHHIINDIEHLLYEEVLYDNRNYYTKNDMKYIQDVSTLPVPISAPMMVAARLSM